MTSHRATDLYRRMRVEGWCIIAATAFAIAFGNLDNLPAHGQCNYEISAIITPDDAAACWPFPPSNTFAQGMNSKGEVVGYYVPCAIGNEQAFYWSAETGFVTLPKPPTAVQAFATGINDHGIIIGRHTFSGVGGKGFVYDPKTGEFTYLEPLHEGATATNLTSANAINNNDVVAGARVISEPGVTPVVSNAVIWMPYGEDGNGSAVVVDLGIGDGPNSQAHDGNDGFDAVGCTGASSCLAANTKAILWTQDVAIELGVLPGATDSYAEALNAKQQVVGASRSGVLTPFRGFLWQSGKMTELVPPEPFDRFRPRDIADFGQIVGGFVEPPSALHAGIWQHGEFHVLSTLTVDQSPQLALTQAFAINENGQILSRATMNGKTVGVLLTPIASPVPDLNFDCTVDVHDLLHLLYEWGKPDSNADLNGNGTVGVPDLLILLANWGS